MANKYIGDVTTSTPALTDFLVGVNGSDAYKTLVSDVAKKIIENYSGSTISGSAQTIQNAFLGVNNNIGANNITGYNNRQGWIALTTGQDLNSVTAPGVYYASSNAIAQSLVNCPMPYQFKMIVSLNTTNTGVIQTIIPYSNVEGASALFALPLSQTVIERKSVNSGTAWSEWVVQPTRSEVNAIANRGGKNLLNNYQVSKTVNGVTLTRNADLSVTLNGTATAQTDFVSNYTIPTGSYIMTGTPQGGSDSTYYLAARVNGSWPSSGRDYGDGARLNGAITSWAISIASGVTLDNVTFYPMIRDASIQDDTYVPYGMSNAELTKAMSRYDDDGLVDVTLSGECTTALTNFWDSLPIGTSIKWAQLTNSPKLGTKVLSANGLYTMFIAKGTATYGGIFMLGYSAEVRLLKMYGGTWRIFNLTNVEIV